MSLNQACALVSAATGLAQQNRLSSLHVTFCTAEEAARGRSLGLMHRVTQQFHWLNRGYRDYDDFLNDLSSRKRKAIRKERAVAASHGLRIEALTATTAAVTRTSA